jgi:hypothetical protein
VTANCLLPSTAHICHIYCSDSQFNLSATTNPAFDAQVKSVNTLPTAQQQFAQGNEVETEAFKTYGLMPTLILSSIIAVNVAWLTTAAAASSPPHPKTSAGKNNSENFSACSRPIEERLT